MFSFEGLDQWGYWGFHPLVASVDIGDGVEVIGEGAFTSQGLQFVSLPDTLRVIESFAFFGQWALTSVEFPSNLRTIEPEAFYLAGLESVDLPVGLESIGTVAFAGCPAVAVTVGSENPYFATARDVLYTKDFSTLVYRPSLHPETELVTPDATTVIGVGACCYQDTLEWIEPQSVVTIAAMGFYRCHSVTDLILPATLIDLGGGCFEGSNLRVLDLPDSVLTCGDAMVYDCMNLEEIWLGNSVTYVGRSAFAYCS
jgi:hypothetical protein